MLSSAFITPESKFIVLQLHLDVGDFEVEQQDLLNFPSTAPLSFILTEFHALLMYPDLIKGVSLLNHDVVFEDEFNEVCFFLNFKTVLNYTDGYLNFLFISCPLYF